MKNGKYEDSDGVKWYRNGLLHRNGGPAIECADGTKHWFIDGQYHRVDGPANEWPSGDRVWYVDGDLHREDGPAVLLEDGTSEWFLYGQPYTEVEFNRWLEKKALKEKLETLPQKSKDKKNKI